MDSKKTNIQIKVKEQECNAVGYDFTNIPMVITASLNEELSQIEGMTPRQIIFTAHMKLLELHKNENIDYLQVFTITTPQKSITFWAMSNRQCGDEVCEGQNVCWMLPGEN